MDQELYIELRILTGLIVSDHYLQMIRQDWNPKLIESRTIRTIGEWCIDYFEKYESAVGKEIENILARKSESLKEVEVEDMEDILDLISSKYEDSETFNVKYLFDETIEYFKKRHVILFADDIIENVERGKIEKAIKIANNFTSALIKPVNSINLNNKEDVEQYLEAAFHVRKEPVIKHPRAHGRFMNNKLIKSKFVVYMGPEKRGKSFYILNDLMSAAFQGHPVALFDAGDNTMEDVLIRIASRLSGLPTDEEYAGIQYPAIRDCIWNQMDKCTLPQREPQSISGPFSEFSKSEVLNLTREELENAYKENPNHKVCYNCSKYWTHRYGVPWVKRVNRDKLLSLEQAKKIIERYFVRRGLQFKISCHPSQTLTIEEMDLILDRWEKEEGFAPSVIGLDYMDITETEYSSNDFRHRENKKWARARSLSQKRNSLVISGTQSDAASYETDLLTPANFSEDKRKYAHVTAMYGLNQDTKGREKDIGILRLNELILRDFKFSYRNQVYLLQDLPIGLPAASNY